MSEVSANFRRKERGVACGFTGLDLALRQLAESEEEAAVHGVLPKYARTRTDI